MVEMGIYMWDHEQARSIIITSILYDVCYWFYFSELIRASCSSVVLPSRTWRLQWDALMEDRCKSPTIVFYLMQSQSGYRRDMDLTSSRSR